ncbi:MAG TPA: ATP-binding cassette domain-containing protein [Anaeromyxobacteraceae bacterium]|nr:ATP-binding cassette domain-containing protein [Anaeromyxobacteraceae bacterium]
MTLLSLDRVDVRLWGATLLEDVSFALREGESWALLGGNGAGKTTFLRLLRGEVWPHPSSRGRRLYHFPDPEPSESPIGARERIALVSAEAQDAYVRCDWDLAVEDVVRTGFGGGVWLTEPLAPGDEHRVDEVLELLGIARLRRERILEVSTGEARRALLARALAPRPRVLLLDEFCNGLDATSRAAVLEVVSRIARGGTPVVFATHRPEEIVPEVRQAAVLERGRLIDQGLREEVLARWRPSPAGRGHSGSAEVAEGEGARRTATPTASATLFSISRADVLVEGHLALRGLEWTMRRDESWAVMGPNGAGKTTFLRLLAAEAHPTPGGRIARLDLGESPGVFEVRARVGLVAPRLQAEHRLDATGEEVVLSGFFGSIGLGGAPTPAQRAAAVRWMDRLGLAHLAARNVHGVSYGELRRLLLARALVHDPEVLLLDEPWNGLDPTARAAMMALVQSLAESGTRLVLVTHHEYEIVPAVNRLLVLREGWVAYAGPWPRR